MTMKRNEFIKTLGMGTLAACAGCSLLSCGTNEPEPKVNITLDLSSTQNAALANVGGSLIRDGIIIVQYETDKFVAFNRACTHQGTPINYQSTEKKFKCPNHGSEFDLLTGNALTGPATVALRSYTTELSMVDGKKQLKITN